MTLLLVFSAGEAGEPRQELLTLQDTWHVDHPTHHVQGLCVSEKNFWISSVERGTRSGWLFRIDRARLTVEQSRRLADGPRYHPGGMQRAAGRLWLPLAEYRPNSTSLLCAVDEMDLTTKNSFRVDDHIGALATDGKETLFAGNWDCRAIYRFGVDGRVLGRHANPTGVAYQDIEWHDGKLWGTGRAKSPAGLFAVVDLIDPTTWRHVARYRLSGTRRTGGDDFAREGFTKFGGDLFLLPEDGPDSTVYRFPLPTP